MLRSCQWSSSGASVQPASCWVWIGQAIVTSRGDIQRGVARGADPTGTAEAAVWLPASARLPERRGREVNVKGVYRLYAEEGLAVRRRRRKVWCAIR